MMKRHVTTKQDTGFTVIVQLVAGAVCAVRVKKDIGLRGFLNAEFVQAQF
jgi:hypothetical protein